MGLHSTGPIIKSVQEQLDDSYIKMSSLQETLVQFDQRLDIMGAQQAQIIELYEGVTVLIKVFAGIEKFAVWIAKVAAAAGILWLIWKFAITQVIEDSLRGK